MLARRATPAEEAARYRVTAEAWARGPGVTLERYVEREHALRAQAYAAEALTTWVLVAEDEQLQGGGAARGQVLASLETLRSPLWVRGRRRGFGYGVCSVFTEAAFRGRGYASHLLISAMAQHTAEDAEPPAFALFSDVGAPLYERCGFVAIPSHDWRIAASVGPLQTPVGGVPIARSDVRRILRARGDEHASPAASGVWALEVTEGRIDWHLERQALHARFARRREPRWCGIELPGGHALWSAHYGKNVLEILDFRGAPEVAKAALRVASAIAAEAGLDAVVVWGSEGWPREVLVAAGATEVEREGSLVMVTKVMAATKVNETDDLGAEVSPAPVSRGLWC